MKKYQYEINKLKEKQYLLVGPLEGIRETVPMDDARYSKSFDGLNSYRYCQVLNGQVVAVYKKDEILDTDETFGL